MRVTDKYTFFVETSCPFSNWHPCNFTVDGVNYTSTEQHMMHQKAVLFDDPRNWKGGPNNNRLGRLPTEIREEFKLEMTQTLPKPLSLKM